MGEPTFRPRLVTRVAQAFLSVTVLPAIGVSGAVLEPLAEGSALGMAVAVVVTLAMLAFGVVLAVRGFLMGVVCRPGEIVVRGYLRTARVPVDRVIAVHVLDAEISWQDHAGRRRRTSVTAFKNGPRTMAPIARHHEQSMERVRAWWLANRGPAA